MSSVAMYLRYRGAKVDPGSLNSWLTSHGGYASGNLIIWGSVNKLGVKYQSMQTPSIAAVKKGLEACHGIIANGMHPLNLLCFLLCYQFVVVAIGFFWLAMLEVFYLSWRFERLFTPWQAPPSMWMILASTKAHTISMKCCVWYTCAVNISVV